MFSLAFSVFGLLEAERQKIQREFETLVADPEMKAIAKKNHLARIHRTTFVDLVTSRTEFSKQDINWVLERLDHVWQQWSQPPQTNQANGLAMLLSEAPDKQNSISLNTKLEQLLEQTRQQQARRQAEATQKVTKTAAKVAIWYSHLCCCLGVSWSFKLSVLT